MTKARELSDYTGLAADITAGDTAARAGRKNMLLNGDYTVWQRSASATALTTDIYSSVDRWKTRVTDTSEFTVSKSSESPSGFASSCKWDCTTANASPSSSASIIHQQAMEGQNLQHLQYGLATAKAVTASFWVRGTVTGVYTVGLYSPDGARHIESSYTISSANTWEHKTITFAGDTGGTLNNDTGEGMRLWFWLGGGSGFSSGTHATSWAAYSQANVLADSQVNLASSTSNDWYIAGVQLETGSVATDFEHRSYGEELALCQRYYEPFGNGWTGYDENGSSTVFFGRFKVAKRTDPTIAALTTNMRMYQWGISDRDASTVSFISVEIHENGGHIKCGGFPSVANGTIFGLGYNSSGTDGEPFSADAEL